MINRRRVPPELVADLSSGPGRPPTAIARAIVKGKAGMASLIALLLGVIFTVLSMHGTSGVAMHSVGYALIGAAAFSLIYQYWADDALARTIGSNIRIAQERALYEIKLAWSEVAAGTSASLNRYTNDVLSMHKRHWPLEVYPEGNEPNPAFNQRLEADLQQATHYDFRGQSGKHLASRLFAGRYPKLEIARVVLEDATVPEVMNGRIYEKRYSAPETFDDLTDDQLAEVVRNDLLDSLIGLYLARIHFADRIEITYAKRPTDVRVEIIDGTVYISPYIRNRPEGNKYPEVFRYDPHSVPAEIAKLEFNREFGLLSNGKLIFQSSTTQAELLEHIRYKGWDLSPDEFTTRYHATQRALRVLGKEQLVNQQ